MRRAVRIRYTDGSHKDLEISKGTSIKSGAGMLYLEKLKDGTWRLTFSTDIADEFSKIDKLEMIRED